MSPGDPYTCNPSALRDFAGQCLATFGEDDGARIILLCADMIEELQQKTASQALRLADQAECISIIRAALHERFTAHIVRDFAKAILHGSKEHRAWLLSAAEAFNHNEPVTPPPQESA